MRPPVCELVLPNSWLYGDQATQDVHAPSKRFRKLMVAYAGHGSVEVAARAAKMSVKSAEARIEAFYEELALLAPRERELRLMDVGVRR